MGLVFVHVQRRACNGFALQGVQQGRFIHHRAAGHVNQVALGAERGQDLCINQMLGTRAAGGDDDQIIRLRGQRLGGSAVGIGRSSHLGAAVVRNRHAKSFSPFGNGTTNAAQADNAQTRTAHLAGQRHGALRPAARTHILVGLRNAPRNREHQAQSQVGYIVVEHLGGVGHRSAALFSGLHVHTVIPHAKYRDQFQGGQLRDQGTWHLGFTLRGDHLNLPCLRGKGCRVGLVQAVQHGVVGVQLIQIKRRQLGRNRQHHWLAHGVTPNIFKGRLILLYDLQRSSPNCPPETRHA